MADREKTALDTNRINGLNVSNGPRLKIALQIQFAQNVAQVLNANVLFMAIKLSQIRYFYQ